MSNQLAKKHRGQIARAVSTGITYRGNWNASTNNPTLSNGSGILSGEYYIVNVAGTTPLDGTVVWGVGDWVISNGAAWEKIDNGGGASWALTANAGTNPVTDFIGTRDATTFAIGTNNIVRFIVSSSASQITSQDNMLLTTVSGKSITVKSLDTGAVTFDSGTTGGVNIGTGLFSKQVTIGSQTGTSAMSLLTGTGGFSIATTGDIGINTSGTNLRVAFTGTGALSIGNPTTVSFSMNAGTAGFINTTAGTITPHSTYTNATGTYKVFILGATPEGSITTTKGGKALDTISGTWYTKSTSAGNTGWIQDTLSGSPITTGVKTSNYTITSSDYQILVDATGADIVLSLPTYGTLGTNQEYKITRLDSSVFKVSVVPTSGTIDGTSAFYIQGKNETTTIASGSTEYEVRKATPMRYGNRTMSSAGTITNPEIVTNVVAGSAYAIVLPSSILYPNSMMAINKTGASVITLTPQGGQTVGKTTLSTQGYYVFRANGSSWDLVTVPEAAVVAAGWSLTGNSGTVAGTNFIGTTDNVDVIIKRNNIDQIKIVGGGDNFVFGSPGGSINMYFSGNGTIAHDTSSAATLTIGSDIGYGGSVRNLNCMIGTGAGILNLATGSTGVKTINIGTGSAANITTIGSTDTSSNVKTQAGTSVFDLLNASTALTTPQFNISGTTTILSGNVIKFNNPANTFSSSIKAGAQTANISYTLPILAPTAGQVLSSSAAGITSWTTVSSSLSSLTAATAVNTIDNLNFQQSWNWSTLSSGIGLYFKSDSLSSGSVLYLESSSTVSNGYSIFTINATGIGNAATINHTSSGDGLRMIKQGNGRAINIQATLASTGDALFIQNTGIGTNIYSTAGSNQIGSAHIFNTSQTTGTNVEITSASLTTGFALAITGKTVLKSQSILQFNNPANTFSTTFKAGVNTANIDYTLPIVAPVTGQTLTATSAGVLSWGRVNATKTTSFSLASTDGITAIAQTAALIATLPSTVSDNVEYTFIGIIDTTKSVTFTAGAGTTIVNPVTFLPVTSFVMPGTTGQYYSLKIIKNNNVWNII